MLSPKLFVLFLYSNYKKELKKKNPFLFWDGALSSHPFDYPNVIIPHLPIKKLFIYPTSQAKASKSCQTQNKTEQSLSFSSGNQKMVNFDGLWSKKTWVGLGLGQFVSLLITSTGFSSSELSRRGEAFWL